MKYLTKTNKIKQKVYTLITKKNDSSVRKQRFLVKGEAFHHDIMGSNENK